ncbi:MAG: hypothetical protein RSD22_08205 [Romboutsia sp.]
MKVYFKATGRTKYNENNVPNLLAFSFIKSFLTDRKYKNLREEYFLGELSSIQVNQSIKDIKWLFRTHKDLDIITIENEQGEISKFVL